MSPVVSVCRLGPVRIAITVDRRQPPSGTIVVDDGPPQAFDGWLGLLRRLSGACSSHPHRPAAAGVSAPPLAKTSATLADTPMSDRDQSRADADDIERLVRLGPRELTWPEVCALAGVSHEVADPLWRALGFPDQSFDPVVCTLSLCTRTHRRARGLEGARARRK